MQKATTSSILRQWLEENSKAGIMGGYPLGDAYSDSRAWPEFKEEEKRYIHLDRAVSKQFPTLRGKTTGICIRVSDKNVNNPSR